MRQFKVLILACFAALSSVAGVSTVAAQVVQGEEHCVVNIKTTDTLNLRSAGKATAKVVTTLPYARCGVVVTGACQGSWCPVDAGHHAGWVNSRFISMVSPARYCVAGVAKNDVLNLRAFPAGTSRILATLKPNQCEISFLPYATGAWQKVRVEGYEGWVNKQFVSGQ